MRAVRMICIFMATILSAGTPAHAVPETGNYGRMISLTGGWTDPNLLVQLDIPFFNPHGCAASNGYMVSATLPANALFSALLLTANARGQRVRFIVDGSVLDRPSVIGIEVEL